MPCSSRHIARCSGWSAASFESLSWRVLKVARPGCWPESQKCNSFMKRSFLKSGRSCELVQLRALQEQWRSCRGGRRISNACVRRIQIRGSSSNDLAQAVGVSLDFVLAYAACEGLPFKVVTSNRVRRAPRQAHSVFAFRADRVIGRAKAGWHGDVLWLEGTNAPSQI